MTENVQFTEQFMIPQPLRETVEHPSEYPFVCVQKGREYFEYGNFSLEPNLRPEDYRLQQFVGKGTFARCYASTFTKDERSVPPLCIKILKRTKEKHYVKLRRELSILTKLQGCPGVIPYHGLVKDPSCVLWRSIPDELVKVEEQDEDMMKSLHQQNPHERHRVALVFDIVNDVPWRSALNTITNEQLSYFLFQILVSLDCAHSHGIMHRDIKPPNCLLDLNNERVVIIDWGQAEYFVPYYKHNVQVGGRSFKAPEFVFGGNIVRGLHDYAVDIWAFGVMMASMIFFGGTKNLFWADDREGVIESISSLLGTVDLKKYVRERPYIELSELTHDLCSEDPQDRDAPFKDSDLVCASSKNGNPQWQTRQTDEALDLLDKILRYNPRERPTARQMITTHPYFEHARQRLSGSYGIVWDTNDCYSPTNNQAIDHCRKVFVVPRQEL